MDNRLAAYLRHAALADVLREDAVVAASVMLEADAPTSTGSTVREARTKKVDAYSALLLRLWQQLQDGDITVADYQAQVKAAFRAAVGDDVPESAQATVADLEQKALDKAARFLERLDDNEDEEASPAQKKNWATMAAGALWAAHLAVEAHRNGGKVSWQTQGDERVCDPCDQLDGTEWRSPEDVPFWPGDPDGPCEGGDNDRCEVS